MRPVWLGAVALLLTLGSGVIVSVGVTVIFVVVLVVLLAAVAAGFLPARTEA